TEQPSNSNPGKVINPAIKVQAYDEFHNLVDGAEIELVIEEATNQEGQISGTTKVVTSNGVAIFEDISINKAGTYTLKASSNGVEEKSDQFEIIPLKLNI